MEINNFEKIYKLIEFEKEGDFYYIQILKRKKDQDVPANHQSVRVVKTYMIESLDYFKEKEHEIITLCNLFNARAGINLHRRNHFDISLKFLRLCLENMENGFYNLSRVYDKVLGNQKSKNRPVWLLDFDYKDENILNNLIEFLKSENIFIYEVLPTYSGNHILTKPFDIRILDKYCKKENIKVDLQRCNPCALYYPDKNK